MGLGNQLLLEFQVLIFALTNVVVQFLLQGFELFFDRLQFSMIAGIVALPLSTSLSRNAFKFFQFSLLPVGLGQELTQLCAQLPALLQVRCALCRLIRKVCLAGGESLFCQIVKVSL